MRFRCRSVIAFALAAWLVLLGACSGTPASPETGSFRSLGDLETALDAVRTGSDPDAFWERVLASGPMPIVFGQTAVFFYRGPGERVEWRGDVANWGPTWLSRGERIGDSDIWRKSLQLLPASRLDYKIVVDGETWMLDPQNPHTQIGGSGANSEARMPDWRPSPLTTRGEGVPSGTLSDDQILTSQHLGYPVRYRVYTPPGLVSGTLLPSIYVTDGPDYFRDEWGAMVTVMDNLIAQGRMRPLVAVFIDPWNLERTENRRGKELVPEGPGQCRFCQFILQELIPQVESVYPVSVRTSDRAILGTSLGGIFSTYMGLWHGDVFGNIGIQSPAYQYPPARFMADKFSRTEAFPGKIFLNVGLYEIEFMWPAVQAADHLKSHNADLLYMEVPDGHSWGHWRTTVDDALLFFFGTPPPG